MTARDQLSQLAAGVGASLTPALPPNEIESFVVTAAGRVIVTTAGGEELAVALRADVPADLPVGAGLTAADVLSKVLPELHRYGGIVPRGVRFYRRSRIMCGQRIIEFVEAGR